MEKEQHERAFFDAWLYGVCSIGEHYFNVDSGPESRVTRIEELEPNAEMIAADISTLSKQDQVFLISMYQLYSDTEARDLCKKQQLPLPSLTDIVMLDDLRKNTILNLLNSYTTWKD